MASWWDSPHLDEAARTELLNAIPPHQRDARSKGIPQFGAGSIYPVSWSDIVVPPFNIPDNWPRGYGMDVGWNFTCAVFGAKNPDSGVIYMYDEHYMEKSEPAIHASAIRARGAWLKGVVDPAARGRSQADGRQLLQDYRDLGLDIEPAKNSVEAGIFETWTLFTSGMLKIFERCARLISELRMYHRDEKGHIVKRLDHGPDALKYFILSGRDRMRTAPAKADPYALRGNRWEHASGSWMG